MVERSPLRTTAAAVLSVLLAGCASAPKLEPRLAPPRPQGASVSQWQTGETDDEADGANGAEDALSEFLAQAGASLLANESPEAASGPADAPSPSAPAEMNALEPEIVHRARIDMARAALVEENLNKERVDLAEELQRELAALQASQTSKSRVRHHASKKQP